MAYAKAIVAGTLEPEKGAELIVSIVRARGSRAFDEFVYLESELEDATTEERRLWCIKEIKSAAQRLVEGV